jgi:tRNA (guanine37-N1)-methyltransferase
MTLFPEIFNSYMSESIMKRAVEKGIIEVNIYNIRDFSTNKHKKVDDYPFGGGAGMVMTPQPIYDTYKHIVEKFNIENPRVIYLTPKGKVHNQDIATNMAKLEDVILLCGHYEGVDQRIIDSIVTDEISIGDYVLTGGELPALILIDSISRLIPGVLNQNESFEEESFKELIGKKVFDLVGIKCPNYYYVDKKYIISEDLNKIDNFRYEITTFRTESTYSDNRRPDSVIFVSTVQEDLSRRDFTVNAIAYNQYENIIDPFGGQEDIKNAIIRTVGNPDTRFNEDALRILRAIRFASTLGFSIEDETNGNRSLIMGSVCASKPACFILSIIGFLPEHRSHPHSSYAL